MRIQNNVPALNAHRYYGINQTGVTKSIAKLSSGYRINSAADDAAGLAISEKMRAQIRGLTMASKNTQDGISLIQTAEGGMQEIDNMLQRMRELVVYASNDTQEQNALGTGDRQKIQDEINQLTAEIDSMAERVEFNKKKVINGSSAGVLTDSSLITNFQNAKATLQNRQKDYNEEKIDYDLSGAGVAATRDGVYNIVSDPDVISALNQIASDTTTNVASEVEAVKSAIEDLLAEIDDVKTKADATDAKVTATGIAAAITALNTAFGGNASANQIANFGKINGLGSAANAIVTALESAYTKYEAAANALGTAATSLATAKANLASYQAAYTGGERTGGLYFQVGANSSQGVTVYIGSLKTDTLGIGNGGGVSNINVLRESGVDITATLDKLDTALSYVTSERSKLGAIQNRLEYTQNSLDVSAENLTNAESRIRDVDMAKEMTNFTKYNILFQASTAMLAQANALPQGVLQMLG